MLNYILENNCSNILLEGKGNLRALSDEAFKYLKGKFNTNYRYNPYGGDRVIGEHCKIVVSKELPTTSFETSNYADARGHKNIRLAKDVLLIIVRFNQDDMLFLKEDSDSVEIDESEELKDIISDLRSRTNYAFRVDFQSTAKRFIGIENSIKLLLKVMAADLNKKPSELKNYIDYQVVYTDINRSEKMNSRADSKKVFGYSMNDNGAYEINTNAFKNKLNADLKKKIDAKLPTLQDLQNNTNIKELFNSLQMIRINGIKYVLNTWASGASIKDMITNNTSSEFTYSPDVDYHTKYTEWFANNFPKKIVVKIILDNDLKLNISNIIGIDKDDNPRDLNSWNYIVVKNEGYIPSQKFFLTEGIEEIKKYFPKLPEDKLLAIAKLDPTYKGGNKLGRYTRWILKLVYNRIKNLENEEKWNELLSKFPDGINPETGKPFIKPQELPEIKDEDLYKIPESVKFYDEYKNIIKTHYNISSIEAFKTLPDLDEVIHELRTEMFKKENVGKENAEITAFRNALKCGLKIVYEDDTWVVGVPETFESSNCFSRVTSWCTADKKSMYEYYLEKGGKYFINLNKTNSKLYQYHFESNQTMNHSDKHVDITEVIGDDKNLIKFYMNYFYLSKNNDELFKYACNNNLWYDAIKNENEIRDAIVERISKEINVDNKLPDSEYLYIISTNKQLSKQLFDVLKQSSDNKKTNWIKDNIGINLFKALSKMPEVYKEAIDYIKKDIGWYIVRHCCDNDYIETLKFNDEIFKLAKEYITTALKDNIVKVVLKMYYAKPFHDLCVNSTDLNSLYYNLVEKYPDDYIKPIIKYGYISNDVFDIIYDNSRIYGHYDDGIAGYIANTLKDDEKLKNIIKKYCENVNEDFIDPKKFSTYFGKLDIDKIGDYHFIFYNIENDEALSLFDLNDLIKKLKTCNDETVITMLNMILTPKSSDRALIEDGKICVKVSIDEIGSNWKYSDGYRRHDYDLSEETIQSAITGDLDTFDWYSSSDFGVDDVEDYYNNNITKECENKINEILKNYGYKYNLQELVDACEENEDINNEVKSWFSNSNYYAYIDGSRKDIEDFVFNKIKDYSYCQDIKILDNKVSFFYDTNKIKEILSYYLTDLESYYHGNYSGVDNLSFYDILQSYNKGDISWFYRDDFYPYREDFTVATIDSLDMEEYNFPETLPEKIDEAYVPDDKDYFSLRFKKRIGSTGYYDIVINSQYNKMKIGQFNFTPNGDKLHIDYILVDKDYRGSGIGKTIISKIVEKYNPKIVSANVTSVFSYDMISSVLGQASSIQNDENFEISKSMMDDYINTMPNGDGLDDKSLFCVWNRK